MNRLSYICKNWPPEHHAYGIASEDLKIEDVTSLLPKEHFSYLYSESYDAFKISDARNIKHLQSEKTDQGAIFVLHVSRIQHEAQNALLKVLEEPTPHTYFFIIYANFKQLLPTLQSRLEIITLAQEDTKQTGPIESEYFLSCSLEERFRLIKTHTDSKLGDKAITRSQAQQLLVALEKHISKEPNKHKQQERLAVIWDAKSFLIKNGSSIKMVLDLVAVYV